MDSPVLPPVFPLPILGTETETFPLGKAVAEQIDQWGKDHFIKLPVVITVGIDQPAERWNRVFRFREDKRLRLRLEKAFALAMDNPESAQDHNPPPTTNGYHLIAVSLFPKEMTEKWEDLEMGPLEDEKFLHGFGYDDPLIQLNALIAMLEKIGGIKTVPWVVFHGSIPIFEITAIRFAQDEGLNGPNTLLCDELLYSQLIKKGLILSPQHPGRSQVTELNADD